MDANNSSDGQQGVGGGTSGSQQGSGGAGGSLGVNNPSLGSGGGVIELSDDSMVKLPGAKDPVRYGDHYRGFQSEFTKRAQEAAGLRAEKAKLTQQLQDHQRRLQQQNQQGQASKPNRLQELAGQLKSLTYLNGEQASQVVENVMQELAGSSQELQKRDMAIALMYKQLKQMGSVLSGLQGRHAQGDFDTKIAKFVKETGLPDKATNWAKKLYLAYEGDDGPNMPAADYGLISIVEEWSGE